MSSSRSPKSRASKNNPSSPPVQEKARTQSAPYQVPKGLKDGPPPLTGQVPLPPKAQEMALEDSPAYNTRNSSNKKQKVTQAPKDTTQVVVTQPPQPTPMEVNNNVVETATTTNTIDISTEPASVVPNAPSQSYDASQYQAAAKDASSRVKSVLPVNQSVTNDNPVPQPEVTLDESMHAP